MARVLALVLAVCMGLPLLPVAVNTVKAEARVVLTIGDMDDRSSNRYDGDDQLGLWQYLEDQLGVEIKYVHLSEAEYEVALASG